ncbi:MAG: hypothetical protein IPL54_03330 [Chitinophagaceae bacterium]|nr:hypothetical protein [Chitinophagaceae bacterium]
MATITEGGKPGDQRRYLQEEPFQFDFKILPRADTGKFSEVQALTFSFVHIDVDLYQPTLDSIEFFISA